MKPGANGLKRSDFAKVVLGEQEITVNLDRLTNKVNICSCWPSKTIALSRKYGYPHQIDRLKGKIASAYWTLPINIVSFRSLRQPS